jgi:hypothetical protein
MVSEIAFALDSSGSALSGVVHAAYWPGDAAVSDGKVDGDRITFTMTGHLPFNANGVTGYPKLCFTGVRNGGEMKIDLLWTESRNTCDKGKLLPMAGRKVTDRARRDEIRIRPCGSWSGYCGLYTAISETDLIQVHNRMVMERIPTFLEVAWRVSMGVWRTANGMDVS